ncbi:MAG: hypothetical protein IPP32_16175 [Bacteroidetes bacterium]|nr:hypothetical protein [Bacteroidota bacterium]
MKRNLISFGNLIAAASIAAVLFVASCKEKEKNFETPCTPPAAPIASNNSPVAVGATINLTAESVSGGSYIWTGPNGFSSNEQNPSFSFTNAKQAGEYLVTVTVDGCTSDAYHTYVSSCIAAPVVGISTTTAVVGDTVSLTSSFNPTATYSWTGPNGYVSAEQNPTIFGVTSLSTGTYTLVMTLPNGTGGGCTTPDSSVTLVVAPQKPLLNGTGVGSINGAVSSPSSTFVDTVNGTLNLSAGTIAGATYQWSGPNGFTSSNQNVAISNLTKAAEGTYYVHAILSGIAGDSTSRKVIVKYAYNPCGADTAVVNGTDTIKIVQIGGYCWTKTDVRKSAAVNVWSYAEVMANTVVDSQSVCPLNWHLASDAEFTNLSNIALNDANAIKSPIQASGAGSGGTNTTGFSAKLGINVSTAFATTSASTSTSSTTVKVGSTAQLSVGMVIAASNATTGVQYLAPGTTITAITNATTFTISTPPVVTMPLAAKVTEQKLNAFYWSSTKQSSNSLWIRQLNNIDNAIYRTTQDNSGGKAYYVRCVRD